jgi:uncharacterized protein involved in type VI secretion and phage assembly
MKTLLGNRLRWHVDGAGLRPFDAASLRQVLGAPSVCEFDGLEPVEPARMLGAQSHLQLGFGDLHAGEVVRVEVRGDRVACVALGPLARLSRAPRQRRLPPMTVRQLVATLAQDHGLAVDAGDLPDTLARGVCQEYETDLQLLRRLAVQYGFLFWESASGLVCRSRIDATEVLPLAPGTLVEAPRVTYHARAVAGEARLLCARDGTVPVVHGPAAGAPDRRPEPAAFRVPHVEEVGEAQQFLARAARAEVGSNCRVQAVVLDPRVVVGTVVTLPPGSGVDEPLLVVEASHEVANRHVVRMVAVPAAAAAPAPAPAHPQCVGVALARVLEVEDPERRGRVRIQRCDAADDGEAAWAMVVQAAAGADHGSFRLPRIGDLVVVSFLGGDPHQPLITGSIYHGAHPQPGAEEQAGTHQRILRTPGGTEVRCEQADDGDSLVVVLQGVTVKLRGGSRPQLDILGQADVSISATSLRFEAEGSIDIQGSKVSIQARDQVEVEAPLILLGK